MTPRRERVTQITAAVLIVGGIVVLSQLRAATLTYAEDFDSTTNRDSSTTARWDIGTGEVSLPSGGASWAAISDLNALGVTSLAFSPSFASDGTAFAGVANGIYRTTDGGTTWTLATKTSKAVVRIATSPTFASDGTTFAITNGDGLWRTADRGASWSKVSAAASGFGVAVSPSYASDRTVFIATYTSIRKSTDGGASWTDQQNGIDATVIENGDLRGVAISRSYGSDQTVFATALGFGVYRSTDGGATWATSNPADLAVQYATTIVTGTGGRVAAAFLDEAYASNNNGTTWSRVASGDVDDLAYGADGSLFLAAAGGPTRSGAAIASGWTAGAAKAIAVAGTYPAASSVLAGRVSGAFRMITGNQSSAVAVSKVVDMTPYRISQATITPTADLPAGTSITYHLSVKDGTAKWEGPVTPGNQWTFIEAGSSLRWRATLVTSDTAVTPSLSRIVIAYDAEDALRQPTPVGGTPSATAIRWNFKDTAVDETGFELHVGEHGKPDERVSVTTKPRAVSNFTFLEETELTPNTEYCNRHVHTLRGGEISPASESYGCTTTLAAVPSKPTVADITADMATLRFAVGAGNPTETEYAIRDTRQRQYIGMSGIFGATSPIWRTWEAWGSGVVAMTGLEPDTTYAFCVLARNRARVETACSDTVTVSTETAAAPPPVNQPPTNQPSVNQPPTNQPPTNQPPTNQSEPPPNGGSPTTNQPSVNQPPINEAPTNTPVTNVPSGGDSDGTSPGGSTGGTVTAAVLSTIAIVAPTDGATTNAQTIVVSGSGPAGAPVSLAVDGAVVADAVTGPAGEFGFVAPSLPDGPHTATATATVAGGMSVVGSVRFTVDRTPPAAPVVASVRAVERVESRGSRDAFDVTFELRGEFTIEEFEALDALLITVASNPVTFTFHPTSREWTYRNTTPLTPGSHTARVAARDRAGNVSLSPNALSFVVPPAQCGDSVDNDTDGFIDFPNDPDCRSSTDDREEREGAVTRAVQAVTTATTVTAKAVAKTTVTAAKATAKTAERTAVVVQEQVLDNPRVEAANERFVAPTVAVAVAANTVTATATTGFQILSYLQHLIGLLLSPGRLIARRKRRAWGTVYASLSKRPVDLATVRLVDEGTKKVIATEVTDHLGRYSFLVKRPGTYRIDVQHQRHTFPTIHLKGRKTDPAYVDLYLGTPIVVGEAGAFLTMNIPIDQREGKEELDHAIIRRYYLRLASAAVSVSGLVFSIVSFSISPQPFVAGVLGLNVLLYLLFRRMASRRPRSWGAVADSVARKPIHLAVARLFDTEFNKLLETAVTDRYGRYTFLVGKNVYYVTGQKMGYALAKSDPIDLTKQEGVIGVDLSLKPQAASRKSNA